MGRDRLRRAAADGLDAGRTVVLAGPAGIGKTEAARVVLRSRPVATGQSLPSLADRHLRPLVHALGVPLHGASDAVAVEVAARLDGRCLCVEDLHWADRATLAVLDLLVGRVPMLLTTRDPEPFDDRVLRLVVPPLGRRSAVALARRMHPDLDPGSLDRLVELSAGNPLLLREFGAADHTTGSPTLEAAIRSRVAELPAGHRTALWLLALHGRPAPAALLGLDPVTSIGRLAEADCRGDLWFTHDLLRVGVEASIDPARWRDLHALLADRCDDADAAPHLLAIGRPADAAAAAERAASSATVTERARLLHLATRTRGPAASDRLRIDAAEALLAAHRPEDADGVLAHIATDDPIVRATAGWLGARAAWMRGDALRACERLDESLVLVDGTDSPIEAHLRVERMNLHLNERPADPALADEVELALAVAERAGVDRARAHSLRGRSLAHSFRTGWRDCYRTAAEIAVADGDADQECAASYWELSALGFFGPLTDALDTGRHLLRRSKVLEQLGWHHQVLIAHGLQSAVAGALDPELVPQLERLLEQDPDVRNRVQARAALALARIDRGDLAAAADMLTAGLAEARTTDDAALVWVLRAELAGAAGDVAGMHTALLELVDSGVGFFGMKVLAEGSAVHLFLHEPDAPEVPRYSDLCPPIVSSIAVERAAYDAVRAGDPATGRARFEDAAERYRADGAPRLEARALHAAAETARRSGDPAGAVRLLGRSRAVCECRGYGSLLATVDRALAGLRCAGPRALLTRRELQVLELVGHGATTTDIAVALGISPATVQSHVDSARRKLGASTRRQAAVMVAAS